MMHVHLFSKQKGCEGVESIELAVNVVQQLGFPIACVISLFYLLYNEMQDRKRRDSETSKLLAENTAAINSIKELIEHLHRGEIND